MTPSFSCILSIALVVLLVLVILLALICAASRGRGRGRGGALGGGSGAADPQRPRGHTPHLHPVGSALGAYARSLGVEHAMGVHPLDRDRYEWHHRAHGGARGKRPKKQWDQYETWGDLFADEGACDAYFRQRTAVLNKPDLDWGPVLAVMGPKLFEDREHIGVVSLDADGRTLRIVASEPSPLRAGAMELKTDYAGVPDELVAKYASRPGLFLFHTHPADPRGCPLPSSHDLSTAIYFGAASRFAACAVISRYGVLVHGLDWAGYKAINEAKDWKLAALSLSHDVIAAHEAIRSWSTYTLTDYLDFYPRHRLLMVVYPAPEMVGDLRRCFFLGDLETPVAYDLLADQAKELADYLDSVKRPKKRVGQRSSTAAPSEKPLRVSVGLD